MADNFTPVQTQKTTLSGSGITSTATSIVLKSLVLPDGSTTIAMTDIGDIGYGTLEPGTVKEEQISFTGITQNGDTTATLTGVTRGVNFVDPYDEISAFKFAHAGGSVFVLSNTAGFYGQYAAKDNAETITQIWTYDTLPVNNAGTPTSSTQFADKAYVDATATGTTLTDRLVVAATAGETLAAGDIVYFDATAKEWLLADASVTATADNIILGIAQGAGTDGNAVTGGVLLKGLDTNQIGMTAGTKQFLSDTAGDISESAGTVEVSLGFSNSGSTTDLLFYPRFDQQITENEQDALGGTSGTPSSSNKYVTNDDTTGTGSIVRESAVTKAGFGNGADGNTTISSGTTTLTRDMYYADLTIETGGIIDPDGFRIFVSGTLDCEGTGKIAINGNNGGTGGTGTSTTGGSGGSAATAAYSAGSLPLPIAGVAGGAGGNGSAAPAAGAAGTTGTSQAKSLCGSSGATGGDGGDHTGAGGNGGAGGTETGTVVAQPNSVIPAYNLFDVSGGSITQFGVAPASGGGAGGGSGNTNDGSGGGGGGTGSSGGCIWISAKTITTLNVDAIGGTGGTGGAAYTASKGGVGGGGAGGNGGVIILIYDTATTINSDVSGGAGGAAGTTGVTTGSSAGSTGNSGTVYTIEI